MNQNSFFCISDYPDHYATDHHSSLVDVHTNLGVVNPYMAAVDSLGRELSNHKVANLDSGKVDNLHFYYASPF